MMNRFSEAEDPISVIQQMIGAASVCWVEEKSPKRLFGEKVFDSDEALKISNEGVERLKELGVIFP